MTTFQEYAASNPPGSANLAYLLSEAGRMRDHLAPEHHVECVADKMLRFGWASWILSIEDGLCQWIPLEARSLL